eukprot:3009078-Rhodomonas_salina.1
MAEYQTGSGDLLQSSWCLGSSQAWPESRVHLSHVRRCPDLGRLVQVIGVVPQSRTPRRSKCDLDGILGNTASAGPCCPGLSSGYLRGLRESN